MITESIYDDKHVIIPMADVVSIEYTKQAEYISNGAYPVATGNMLPNGIFVIMKETKWQSDIDTWANAVHIPEDRKQSFISAWCRYRSELEAIN